MTNQKQIKQASVLSDDIQRLNTLDTPEAAQLDRDLSPRMGFAGNSEAMATADLDLLADPAAISWVSPPTAGGPNGGPGDDGRDEPGGYANRYWFRHERSDRDREGGRREGAVADQPAQDHDNAHSHDGDGVAGAIATIHADQPEELGLVCGVNWQSAAGPAGGPQDDSRGDGDGYTSRDWSRHERDDRDRDAADHEGEPDQPVQDHDHHDHDDDHDHDHDHDHSHDHGHDHNHDHGHSHGGSGDNPDFAFPAEGDDGAGGGSINGKNVWSLPGIFDNFFRDGHWENGDPPLTYSFPNQVPSGYVFGGNGDDDNFTPFSFEQRSWAEYAMEMLDDFIDPEFTNVGTGDHGGIRFMNTERDTGSAHAYGPWNPASRDGDIWIHSNWESNGVTNFQFGINSSAVETMIHEIGHIMGLKHPGEYDASDGEPATYQDDAYIYQDSEQYTIMSYFASENTSGGPSINPTTFMLHDVYALQREYGAEMSTRTGDTTYGFNSNTDAVYDITQNPNGAYVIWDAGGYDTWDLSEATNTVELDLRPGTFSSWGGYTGHTAIAYDFYADDPSDSWIERAYGGAGDDLLTGNDANNALYGRDGVDTIFGGNGIDSVYGGEGDDWLHGDNQGDWVYGGDGVDHVYGGDGGDALYGNAGADFLYGGGGADAYYGGGGDDVMFAAYGIDSFNGGSGQDRVDFRYSDVDWNIDLEAGTASNPFGTEQLTSIEYLNMGDGDDTIHLSDADNAIETGLGADVIYRNGGNNNINGQGGIDHVSYANATHGVEVSLGSVGLQKVIDRGGSANDEYDRLTSIENLTGSNFADELSGSGSRANTIYGGSGGDEIDGVGHINLLFGGGGDDTFITGTGVDHMYGGFGLDMASFADASAGVDVNLADGGATTADGGTDFFNSIEGLIGSAHADTLRGWDDDDRLQGGAGDDDLFSGAGDDRSYGGAGDDLVRTDSNFGGGDDYGFGGSGDDILLGVQGDDHLYGGADDDSVFGGTGNDHLRGGSGNDSIFGGSGSDDLYGDNGNDVMAGGTGNDDFYGGAGVDYADYHGLSERVVINLGQEYQSPQHIGSDRFYSMEGVIGTSHDDILWANGSAWGHLFGGAGDDELQGGVSDDEIYGGADDDEIKDTHGDDIIDGGAGRDLWIINANAAGVTVNLALNSAQDTGGAGTDTLSSIEDVDATNNDDVLLGNAFNNELVGRGGDDDLQGRDGNDQLFGGDGDDVVDGGNGHDYLDGGAGDDTLSYASVSGGVTVSLADQDSAQTTGGGGWDFVTGFEHLTGSTHDDHLYGDGGANVISDLQGDDVVMAGGGRDMLIVGLGGADIYNGGGGKRDTLSFEGTFGPLSVDLKNGTAQSASTGVDQVARIENVIGANYADDLRGDSKANRLYGDANDDQLRGRGGDDRLFGGEGDDTMWGNAGADQFRFASGDGDDTIMDFAVGEDSLVFTGGGGAVLMSDQADGVLISHVGGTVLVENVFTGDFDDASILFL